MIFLPEGVHVKTFIFTQVMNCLRRRARDECFSLMLNPPREVTRCILDLLPAPSLARLTGMCSELLYADMVRVPASQAPEHSVSRIVDVLLRRAATRDRVDESRVGYSLASRLALREWRLCEHVRDATGVHRARHPVDGEKDQHSRAGHPTLNSAFATTFTMAPACSVSAACSMV